jgi:Kef-type K+ transport system membrane component KefB
VVAGSVWDSILFAVVLTAVAFGSKIVGCAIPAKYVGMSKWDAISVGVGMTPRLEIAFIIAYYGLSSGIIENDIYSVVVFMGIVTALITPPVLKRTLRRGGHKAFSI